MRIDRTTTALLFAIALGLWLNLAAGLSPVHAQAHPNPLDSIALEQVLSRVKAIDSQTLATASAVRTIESDIAAIEATLRSVESNIDKIKDCMAAGDSPLRIVRCP